MYNKTVKKNKKTKKLRKQKNIQTYLTGFKVVMNKKI